ncbi:TcdA/TcdB pore-forming domain-containing protein [Pigmentibacter sp. JX0631]|uniref:TcdA/TcdB pore-forming domain-containing protein n=1 Tax=Pigmentibacter sp. JX0631 TaxID=2976982 RepID=UPI0024683061|nr:TcdA/TcdB pore-forming domain-containing protein [Pigmentibacter sp. JX0631]WGL59187.1 TcdA/TcdB pore-forming domain-containing protein [Pigmentibacter sp. JX0631]
MKFSILIIFLKFVSFSSVFVIISCKNKEVKFAEIDSKNHIQLNYSKWSELDFYSEEYLNELKNVLKKERTISANVLNQINFLKSLKNSTNVERKYLALIDFIKTLPKPYLNTPYKLKYEELIQLMQNYYEKISKPVPRIIHFIWLGGPLGDAQKNYIKIWAKLNSSHQIHIWYDSNHLYAYNTKKHMKEFASLSLYHYRNEKNYETLLAEKIIEEQNKLFEYFKKEVNSDSARVKYLHENIKSTINFEEEFKLNSLKMNDDIKNIENEIKNIKFKNINDNLENWKLKEFYIHELNLRSNYAGAADIVRAKILNDYGGIHIDADLLPASYIFNSFIEKNTELKSSFALPLKLISLVFLEKLFKVNKNLNLSETVTSIYTSKFRDNMLKIQNNQTLDANFKEKFKNLEAIIDDLVYENKFKEVTNIFSNLNDIYVREGEFKIVYGNNSFIASHPTKNPNDWMFKINEKIYNNYLEVSSIKENNPKLSLPFKKIEYLTNENVSKYRYDSLIFNSSATVVISGPMVYHQILQKESKFNSINSFEYFNDKFSYYTPESEISSWYKNSTENVKLGNGIILQIGDDENTKTAADNYFKKYAEKNIFFQLINDNLIIENNQFKATGKFDLYPEENLTFSIIGHSEKLSDNSMSLGGLNADFIAEKIGQNFSGLKKIDYLNIITCNPEFKNQDTSIIESFTKKLMDAINAKGIIVNLASFRATQIRIDQQGEKFYFHENKFTAHRNNDKIYILRNSIDNYLTIKAEYHETDFTENYRTAARNYFENIPMHFRTISEQGASGPLGDLSIYLDNLQQKISNYNDYHSLAIKISEITKEIRNKKNLSEKYAPFFSTIDEKNKSISFTNVETGHFSKDIILKDDEFKVFKETWNLLQNEMKSLDGIKIKTNNDGVINYLNEGEGLGMTPLFMAQTLYSIFKTETLKTENALSKIFQFQAYLFYSQLSLDILSKIDQLEFIIKQLIQSKAFQEEKNFVSNIDHLLGKLQISRYLGVGFSFANVALDAFELAYVDNNKKSIFATQLAFDSVNAFSTLANISIGEGIASSVLGYLSTPLAGLSIGFTGFATASINAQEEAISIAKYFNEYAKDHSRIGIMDVCGEKNKNTISLMHSLFIQNSDKECKGMLNSAVITTIDLQTENKLKLTYGSHSVSKTKNWDAGVFHNYFSNFQGSSKFPESNKNEFFNLRESISQNMHKEFDITGKDNIILPFLVEKNISYSYSYTPGIMSRNNDSLTTVDILASARKNEFIFRYFVDLFEYGMRNLFFETKNININVLLGKKSRNLIFPEIPLQYLDKLSYTLKGSEGKYSLLINDNLSINIIAKDKDKWIFNLQDKNIQLKFISKGVFFGGRNLKIYFTGNLPKEIVINEEKKSYKLEPANGKILEILELDFNEFKKYGINEKLFNTIYLSGSHNSFIKINKYVENNVNKIAWYDVKNSEILSPYLENEENFNFFNLKFMGRNKEKIYYFDLDTRIIFEQNILVKNKVNTKPLARVMKNTEPFFDLENGLIYYKMNLERSLPASAQEWEFLVARNSDERTLIEVNINAENIKPEDIESILKNQIAFNINQAVKFTFKSNFILGWYIKKNKDINFNKFIKLKNTKINNLNYVGYYKNSKNEIFHLFSKKDKENKIFLFRYDEKRSIFEKIILPVINFEKQNIISLSVLNNIPIIMSSSRFLYHFNQQGELVLSGINFSFPSDKTDNLEFKIKSILKSHIKHEPVITLVDSIGNLAWYHFSNDLFLLFDSNKKYLGNNKNGVYFFKEVGSNKIYVKNLKSGNLKNYKLEQFGERISFKSNSSEEDFILAKNLKDTIYFSTPINFSKESVSLGDKELQELNYFKPLYKERSLVESNLAASYYSGILRQNSKLTSQVKLDEKYPKESFPRRSIMFVNEGWYNSAIEIEIQDIKGKKSLFHSWWGSRSKFTITPQIPINTSDIKISIQSYLFGWDDPFFVGYYKLSDLPLCLNTSGTIFNQKASVNSCNH